MSAFRLAIDYGTSTTVGFLRRPDGRDRPLLFDDSPLLPSAVYLEDDGRYTTGRDAVRSAKFDPARFEANPKQRIGDGEVLLGWQAVPVVDLVAATLRRVWQEAVRVAEAPPGGVTLTCPAAWGDTRRTVLIRAAEQAGLPAPALVEEPVAAATYFAAVLGSRVPPGGCAVVYDLGAGTFDVSVVRREPAGFSPVAGSGLPDLGGLDLDALVVTALRDGGAADDEPVWRRLDHPGTVSELRAFRDLWDGAREAKEALSRRPSTQVSVPGLDQPRHLTRAEFEAAAQPLLSRTVAVTTGTIRAAGVSTEQIAGLFLVGGSTRVPLVASLLHRAIGIAPTVIEQPELVVAEGALFVDGGRIAADRTPTGPAAPLMPAAPVPPLMPAAPVPPLMPAAPVSAAPVSAAPAVPPLLVPPPLTPPVPARAKGSRRRYLAAAGSVVVLAVLAAVALWAGLERDGSKRPTGSPAGPVGSAASKDAPVAPEPASEPAAATAATPSAPARNSAPAGTGEQATAPAPAGPPVVSFSMVVTRSTYNGPCPPPDSQPVEIRADITVTGGPTTVRYYWRSDPAWDGGKNVFTEAFTRPGTRASKGFYGGWGTSRTISYWVQLVIEAPTPMESKRIQWSTTCTT